MAQNECFLGNNSLKRTQMKILDFQEVLPKDRVMYMNDHAFIYTFIIYIYKIYLFYGAFTFLTHSLIPMKRAFPFTLPHLQISQAQNRHLC